MSSPFSGRHPFKGEVYVCQHYRSIGIRILVVEGAVKMFRRGRRQPSIQMTAAVRYIADQFQSSGLALPVLFANVLCLSKCCEGSIGQ